MIHRASQKNHGVSIVVFSPFYPPSMGGLQNHAQEFNYHLAELGYTLTVFTPRVPHRALEHEVAGARVTIIRYPAVEIIANWPLPQFWRPRFWTLLAPLYRQPADIVIGRTRFFATTWLALLFARVTHRPYVHIEHGANYVQMRHWPLQLLGQVIDHTLGRLVLQSAAHVIANSKKTAAFVTKLAPRIKPTVIYRGVEVATIEDIPPADRPPSPLPTVRIGYFGRLIAGKGIADFIESVALLRDHPIEVIIVGDGPDYDRLVKLVVRQKLTRVIQFVKNTAWPHAIALLKTCDIVVNPSYTEGLPTALLEAALCHKAIVATDVGGTSEIIRHRISGLLVSPHDSSALTQALRELLQKPLLRSELGEAAYREVSGKFEWSRAVALYHDIFMRLLL